MSDHLGVDDLVAVQRKLFAVNTEWYNVGLELGLQVSILDSIGAKYSGDPSQCFRHVLKEWLKGVNPPPTWQAMINALESPTVAQYQVAKQIRTEIPQAISMQPLSPQPLSPQLLSPQPPSTSAEPRSKSLGPGSDERLAVVRQNNLMIRCEFAKLVKNASSKLQSIINIDEFRVFVVSLFQPGDCIPDSVSVHEIFRAITKNGLWDCVNYFPLKQIIKEFDCKDNQMSKWVKQYEDARSGYMLGTKISEHIDVVTASDWSDIDSDERLEEKAAKYDARYYRKLSVKVKAKVTKMSLEYVSELWRSLASHYDLPSNIALLESVHDNCILIVWLVPTKHTLELVKKARADPGFFREHDVLWATVDDDDYLYNCKEDPTDMLMLKSATPETTHVGNLAVWCPTTAIANAQDQSVVSAGTGILDVPCLGRPFRLWTLYDYHKDCLIPSVVPEKLQSVTHQRPQPKSNFKLISEDSLTRKALHIGIQANMKLSILMGLVKTAGSAKYLDDHKSFNKLQARVTLKYSCTTRYEEVTIENLHKVHHVTVSREATHIVTGVLYGIEAFFVFDQEVPPSLDYQTVHEKLIKVIKSLPDTVTVKDMSNVQCTVYGDFHLRDRNPMSFQDAAKLLKELPELAKSSAIPIQVTLYPLSKLYGSGVQVPHEISPAVVMDAERFVEAFHQLQVQYNDIMKSEILSNFPGIHKQLSHFKEIMDEYKFNRIQQLAGLIPLVRGGETQEAELTKIFRANEVSPFRKENMHSWLKKKEHEVKLLANYLGNMKEIEFVAPHDLDGIIHNFLKYDSVLCFSFPVIGEDDAYLQCLSDYLQTPRVRQRFDDAVPQQWHEDATIVHDMRSQAKQFTSFFEANKTQPRTKFIVSSCVKMESSDKGAVTVLFNAVGIPEKFFPTSQPGKPTPIKVTNDSIQLAWDSPEHGAESVKSYTISYSKKDDPTEQWAVKTTDGSENTIMIMPLAPKTKYRFKVHAQCNVGRTLESELSDPIETIPKYPHPHAAHLSTESVSYYQLTSKPRPGKPNASKVTSDTIHLNWLPPESGTQHIESYSVSYRRVDKPSQWWTTKTQNAQEFAEVSGLAPKAAYCFKVCAEYQVGASLDSEVSDSIETGQALPGKPGKPKAAKVTHNSIQLHWPGPEYEFESNIEFYSVLYRPMNYPSTEWQIKKTNGAIKAITLSGLKENTSYFVKVCAGSEAGVGPDSETSDPIVTSPLPLPGRPGKPMACNVQHNSVHLNWPGPMSGVQFYSVFYCRMDDPSTEWQLTKTQDSRKEVTVSGLAAKAVYCFKVRAECDAGISPDSDSSDPIKTSSPPVPGRPGKPTASKETHNSVRLNWPSPKTGIEGIKFYSVIYRRMDDMSADWQTTKTMDSQREVIVSGLAAKAIYCFKVRAECEAYVSPDSEMSDPIVTSTPPLPGRPGTPTASKVTHNSIRINWSGPISGFESVNYYLVLYRRMDDPSAENWQTIQTQDSQKELTVSGLATKAVYCFKVCTVGEAGVGPKSDTSEPIRTMPPPKPGRPGKPKVSKVTHNSIDLNWHGPESGFENVKFYSVFYCRLDDPSAEWQTAKTLDSQEEVTVGGLAAKTVYCFKVRAECEGGVSPESELSDPTATSPPPVPGRPGKPTASKMTHNSIHLNWPGPKSGIEGVTFYSVLYRRIDDTSAEWQTAKTQDPQKVVTVSGLAAKALYCFKVRAECETDVSPYSDLSDPIATSPPPVPERPGKPMATKVTYNSIHLNWSGPGSGVEFYSVLYRRMDDPSAQWQPTKTQDPQKQVTVSGLAAKTVYCFKVRAECEAGVSPYSDLSDPIGTNPPPVPERPGKPMATKVTHNFIHLNWPGPGSGIESVKFYSVLYRRMDDPSAEWQTTKTQDFQKEATVSELAAKAVYCFRVRAECEAGFSPYGEMSDPIATSSPPLPGRPGKPMGSQLMHNSIYLVWSRPESFAQEIKCYSVSYCQADDPSSCWQTLKTPDAQEFIAVSGLEAKVAYVFKVRAECESGLGAESESSEIVTSPLPKPSCPGKPNALEVTHNIIDLTWSHPEYGAEYVNYYTVSYKKNGSTERWKEKQTDGAVVSLTVCNLAAKTKYRFKVRAESDAGASCWSEVSRAIETHYQPLPSQPGKPYSSRVTHDTVVLNWNAPDCGAQYIKYYTVFYYVVEDHCFPEKWKTKKAAALQETLEVTGLKPSATFCFKVQAVSDAGCSSYSESSDPIRLHAPPTPSQPGKPTASGDDIIHNSILLNWAKPVQGSDYVKYYTILYRKHDDPMCQWQTKKSDGARTALTVSGLDPKTKYWFKVNAVGESSVSVFSDESEFNTTAKVRLSEGMLSSTSAKLVGKGPPKIYKLILQRVFSDEDKMIRRFSFGNSTLRGSTEEKVILVVGATGAGKTTLINGMTNYILGVEWGDGFRFKLIDEGYSGGPLSVTQWITAYTFHHQKGSPLPYTLTIIDTPGFGQSGGLESDHRITEQITALFSMPPPHCIDHLNAIAVVTQATLTRLTPTQKYIFDSILAIFGKDIASNIFMMATFADGGVPPVIAAIKTENIPSCGLFKFNNNSLFVRNDDYKFAKLSCEMGLKSFEDFFGLLNTVETRSLRLTREVLDKRKHLDVIVQELLAKVKTTMHTMKQELQQGMISEAKQILARLDEIALKPNPLNELDYINLLIQSEEQQRRPGYMKRLEYLQEARYTADLIHQLKEGSNVTEWLKVAVQKAKEYMNKHSRGFQVLQQAGNTGSPPEWFPLYGQHDHPSISLGTSSTRPHAAKQLRTAVTSSADNSPLVDLLTNEELCKTIISLPSVPYIDPVEVVMCDSTGGTFYSSTHDFGFAIPEGAIPEGDSINIEVGVTLTGPFDFPQGSKPVSPIVKLCVQQQPNYQFLKPVEVVLPHYLDLTSEEDNVNSDLHIGFLKAGHELNHNQEYKFEQMDLSDTHFKHEYGILRTNHFCLLCIGEGVTHEDTAKALFYLVGYCKIMPDPTMWKVYFCVAYFLKTCVEALRRQFPVAEDYQEIFKTEFKFTNQPLRERKIEISFEKRDSGEWVLALQSDDKIRATGVDFWSIDAKVLELKQAERTYPPRFQIQAYAERCVCTPILFQGAAEDIKVDLLLKPANLVNASRATSMESEPELRDLMNKVAAKLPNKWWDVGIELDLTGDELENLRTMYGGNTRQCFTMVFEYWKKRTRNYSWAAIITALEAPLVGEKRLADELKAGSPSCENVSADVQNRGAYQRNSFPALNLARKNTRLLGKCPSSETLV